MHRHAALRGGLGGLGGGETLALLDHALRRHVGARGHGGVGQQHGLGAHLGVLPDADVAEEQQAVPHARGGHRGGAPDGGVGAQADLDRVDDDGPGLDGRAVPDLGPQQPQPGGVQHGALEVDHVHRVRRRQQAGDEPPAQERRRVHRVLAHGRTAAEEVVQHQHLQKGENEENRGQGSQVVRLRTTVRGDA